MEEKRATYLFALLPTSVWLSVASHTSSVTSTSCERAHPERLSTGGALPRFTTVTCIVHAETRCGACNVGRAEVVVVAVSTDGTVEP